jgi:hypothetical protein
MRYDIRGEEVSYLLGDKKLSVAWTHVDGQRIYTDSIDTWDDGAQLTAFEKSAILKDIVLYIKKQTRERPIVVINTDFDKAFWETECNQLKMEISATEYTSEREKDEFLYRMFLEAIPNLTIEGVKISTKEDLDSYWATRKKDGHSTKFQ